MDGLSVHLIFSLLLSEHLVSAETKVFLMLGVQRQTGEIQIRVCLKGRKLERDEGRIRERTDSYCCICIY